MIPVKGVISLRLDMHVMQECILSLVNQSAKLQAQHYSRFHMSPTLKTTVSRQ